jgi:antitoxin ParD1/3/4
MSTIKVSLPDSIKALVDERVICGGFGTVSEYVRELISKDQDRLRLHALLIAGANSMQSGPADAAYFATLRERIESCTGTGTPRRFADRSCRLD